MLGMSIRQGPGEPSTTYHWETEQEAFPCCRRGALDRGGRGAATQAGDFVHCPPETRHTFVGAGDGPCVLLCARAPVPEGRPVGLLLCRRGRGARNASPSEETQDTSLAYARFPPSREIAYPGGLLPGD
jgi:hypothetical protein